MGEALREAGVNTDNLTEESKRLEQEMARLRNEQDQAADSAESFGEQAGAAFEAISSAILAAGISDKLREIGSAYMETVKTAGDFEASMSQVAARLQQEVNDGMGQIGPVIDNATQSLQSLMETYQAAYDEALKSIQGQYALWDDVAGVSAVSAETINSKIEKQAEYWADYNKNLEAFPAIIKSGRDTQ